MQCTKIERRNIFSLFEDSSSSDDEDIIPNSEPENEIENADSDLDDPDYNYHENSESSENESSGSEHSEEYVSRHNSVSYTANRYIEGDGG